MVKRILVIDDDTDILAIVGSIFFEEGIETVLLNKDKTVREIKSFRPDMILLDVSFVGHFKNGAEIYSEIKGEWGLNAIPVIMISAESDLEALSRFCLAYGFIKKPFDLDHLPITVKKFLIRMTQRLMDCADFGHFPNAGFQEV